MKRTHPHSKFIRFSNISERIEQVFDKNGAYLKFTPHDMLYGKYKEIYGLNLFDHIKVPIVVLQVMPIEGYFLVEYVDECDYIIEDNNIVTEDE